MSKYARWSFLGAPRGKERERLLKAEADQDAQDLRLLVAKLRRNEIQTLADVKDFLGIR